jgi:hypothetical protein
MLKPPEYPPPKTTLPVPVTDTDVTSPAPPPPKKVFSNRSAFAVELEIGKVPVKLACTLIFRLAAALPMVIGPAPGSRVIPPDDRIKVIEVVAVVLVPPTTVNPAEEY